METRIDWSKAPEGATHYTFASGALYGWLKVSGKSAWYWADSLWESYSPGCACRHIIDSEIRPSPEIIPWTGEGLPPVGIEIEALLPGLGSTTYFWQRAKVVHGALPDSPGEVLVFSLETTRPAWVDEFRPVRTPEQIAAEERTKTIDDMVKALGMDGPGQAEYIRCGLIYDAGYRKQVQP